MMLAYKVNEVFGFFEFEQIGLLNFQMLSISA